MQKTKQILWSYFKKTQFWDWVIDRAKQVPQENYDILKILMLIETQFNLVFSYKTINLKIDSD